MVPAVHDRICGVPARQRCCGRQGSGSEDSQVHHRPAGHLTNDRGTGRVAIADDTAHASIPREDVAAVLLAVLDAPGTFGQTFEVISGDTALVDAIAALVP